MKLKNILCAAALCSAILPVNAANNCDMRIAVVDLDQTEEVPAAVTNLLHNRLTQTLTATGATGEQAFGQFIIGGRFNHILHQTLAGPPTQTALQTTLTLYIGDTAEQRVFATETFELRGVGTSLERAYINALGQLNSRNAAFAKFLESASTKIIAWFDTNYPSILHRANNAATMHNFEQALYLVGSIPECCSGYDQAERALLDIFQKYIDYNGVIALNQARAIWAADPTANGARDAFAILLMIDPSSSAYPQAQALLEEIKRSVRSDYDFETREKYRDQIEITRARIEAARAIGVAFGNGQQPTTSNYWMR